VAALYKKFVPQDLVFKIKLRQELNTIKMNQEDDSSKLFELISRMENKYNTATYQLPLEDKIAAILENAPVEYSIILTCEQLTKVSGLQVSDIQEEITQFYCTMYGKDNNDKNNAVEFGLLSSESENQIKCYYCKKTGHKAFQYSDRKKKKHLQCKRCNKKGHLEKD